MLARRIRDRIAGFRQAEQAAAYEHFLFAPNARPEISFAEDFAFRFREGVYRNERLYKGPWKPSRHFLGAAAVPAFDGRADGEEAGCARALDRLPGVKYWIRNVAGHEASFRLPIKAGRFYPDFAARMEDGRTLVAEYKGAHIADTANTAEKRAIGDLWARKSEGWGIFVLVERDVAGKDAYRQLADAVGAAPG